MQPLEGEPARLIGGPFDGEWRNVPADVATIECPEYPPLGPVMNQEEFKKLGQILVTWHVYVRQIWSNSDRSQVRVFIWEHLDPNKVMEHILTTWNPRNSRGGEAAKISPGP